MKFNNEVIGSRLIETITSGLYDGNLNCLREYVQNSIDSKAENIEIYFENINQDLIIEDNGSGMSKKKLEEALSIGISGKSDEDVGWRGIGIWSGVPAGKRIVIITKKKKDKKYRIEIDNDKLRSEYGSNKPVLDILTNATGEIEELELGKDESIEESHFTMVRLESILPTQKNIFTEKAIIGYLSRVVPAPFDSGCFTFAAEIDKWLKEKRVILPAVNIKFQGNKIFRPPLKSDIFFNNVIKKEFKVNDKLVAVGWFLTTNGNKILAEPNGGIYFKKKGFTIGDENLVRNQYTGTYNQWQYGEIHIVSKELRENAARNNFEYNNSIVYPFLEYVGKFIGQLQMQNRYQSIRVVSNTIKKAQKHLDEGNLRPAKKEVNKINDRLATPASFPTDPSLQSMKTLIDTESEQSKKVAVEIEKKIKKIKPDTIKEKKEQLEAIVNNLPASVKDSISRASKKGLLYPEISVTDAIKEILKEKTGLNNNEIFDLSKTAYGWESVSGNNSPLLTIDPLLTIEKDKDKPNRRLARNRRFGVMVYTVHDLFVNLCKHEKGKDSFKWFEDITEEEKYELLAEMYAVIGLIYRLIEKSEKYQPSLD